MSPSGWQGFRKLMLSPKQIHQVQIGTNLKLQGQQ
jgi:hypothetical protein